MNLVVGNIIPLHCAVDVVKDEAIPLQISFNFDGNDLEIFHFERVTENDSFFEIEVFKRTGRLKSLTLLNCNKNDLLEMDENPYEALLDIKSLEEPIIDLKNFQIDDEDYFSNFHRENHLEILQGSNFVCIKLEKFDSPKKFINLGGKCFLGISHKDEIVHVVVC